MLALYWMPSSSLIPLILTSTFGRDDVIFHQGEQIAAARKHFGLAPGFIE